MSRSTLEKEAMGQVVVRMQVTNNQDEGLRARGVIQPSEVRSVAVDVLVDTGAMLLALPEDVIEQLGLPPIRKAAVRLADGTRVVRQVYSSARLQVQGRDVTADVLAIPRGATPLLGQIPLEGLDFLVDPARRCLVPNPASPDPSMAQYDLL